MENDHGEGKIVLTWSYAYEASARKLYKKIVDSELANDVELHHQRDVRVVGGYNVWIVNAVVEFDNTMAVQKIAGRSSEY